MSRVTDRGPAIRSGSGLSKAAAQQVCNITSFVTENTCFFSSLSGFFFSFGFNVPVAGNAYLKGSPFGVGNKQKEIQEI